MCRYPSIEIFVMGSNTWFEVSSFPPKEAQRGVWYLDLSERYLNLSGATTRSKLTETTVVEISLDPRNPTPAIGGVDLGSNVGPLSQAQLIERSDVLVLSSPPLKSDLTLFGESVLKGAISPDKCTPDVAVTLMDRFPHGDHYLVAEGIRRSPTHATSSEVEIALWPTAYTFKRGHRIEVVLAPAKFPKYDLPPCVRQHGHQLLPLRLRQAPDQLWRLNVSVVEGNLS
jgi:putative CocE/NonD family hydrolase